MLKIKCKICEDIIDTKKTTSLKRCKCRAIGVDAGDDCSILRIIGPIENIEYIKDEDINSKEIGLQQEK